MRRSELYIAFSFLFTVLLFALFRTPFLLYFGLVYSLVLYLRRFALVPRAFKFDVGVILGIALMAISPVFLVVRFGEYTSPSTFHALFLLGLFSVFFEVRDGFLPLIPLAEAMIALIAKTDTFEVAVNWLTHLFMDITSYLVRGLIDIFNLPIAMKGNVAVVRNSMVIIGSGCSGLDAFILYILAALLLIYLRKSSRREAALLLVGALGIIPLNAVRIFTLLVIGYHSGISFLELFHSHLGDLMFVAYVFLYWWAVLRWKKQVKGEEKLTAS
ncbi:archaeosortase/exosortase family protein [Thermococcus pacificus]|uniref:Exosortase/archaeosortase family protein n=1 Tax=Thermococcus pacificus TaxID=71998 RepID=A0A218P6G8_9EURY|nr:archaeosortase/exosortase family protein [Thermococcus pacificus]ASJ06372.1 exosortase/archaeosortase family protein [Thermococcus pacificus]